MPAEPMIKNDQQPAPLHNLNVDAIEPLPAPAVVRADLPLTSTAQQAIVQWRAEIAEIIDRRDSRLLVVVGPCSIHDLDEARDYSTRLQELKREIGDRIVPIMRVYFEKPRTTVGWKGFINDPYLDDSFAIEYGIREARRFLIELAEIGLPAATEALDPIIPQYVGDLISWYAIGARTTESQTHREMASGLSAPCGFKNGTDGAVDVAINAIRAAREPHRFLGVTDDGRAAVIRTRGNPHAHLILRGGKEPNHDPESVRAAAEALDTAGLTMAVMVDCSHGNSRKDPRNQPQVAEQCVRLRAAGQDAIVGLMIESHLHWGNQPITSGRKNLRYGVSITDACIDWDTTVALLRDLHGLLGN